MKIKELKEEHPAIYKRALECQIEQGNEPNDNLTLFANKKQGNFDWAETIESGIFWESISYRGFQVFYERYPEHSKQPVNVEEKAKDSDEELIAEAERRYPKGTKVRCGISNCTGIISGNPYFFEGRVKCHADDINSGYVYLYVNDRWAEIVSTPNQETPEPKAGDMVEVYNGSWCSGWTYTGGRLKSGSYVCEGDSGIIVGWVEIRLPQKSEVESKVNNLVSEWNISNKTAPELLLDAIKWGQQNTNAK